ncbi:GNAT family N-acetyltransferase [Corallococcus sp. H22C18031201]|nr:GNAT family N-acetyltransferase [Corallococcus sp. H22C18031201]
MSSSIVIRPEASADSQAIETVTVSAFLEAPHTSHNEQDIVRALREAGALTVSLVAEDSGVIIGHVAISPVSIADGAGGWFGLGPISVMPERQGTGIGAALMRAALQRLRDLGASGCVVLGDPAYYGRFGFRAEPSLVFPGVEAAYFQAQSFTGRLPQGVVTYHPAFYASFH